MSDITLTDEQNQAIKGFMNWFKSFNIHSSKRFHYISGPAGTGKTTICKYILDELESNNIFVCCCTFTGKASVNFTEKTKYTSNTIHSVIYKPVFKDGKVIDWKLNFYDSPILISDLILIDEISMVYKELWEDLLKYNKPILVFGDPYQLPPVNNDLLFNEDDFDFLLKTVHRQALDNPIIRLSKEVREGKNIPYGTYGDKVVKIRQDEFSLRNLNKFDQVICGKNDTRRELNAFMRKLKGYNTILPSVNEKLICLRNNREMNSFNGQIYTSTSDVLSNDKRRGVFDIYLENDYKDVERFTIFEDEFTNNIREERWKILKKNPWFCQFDYGYVISCHKSQGSEWNNVCVFDESYCFRDDRKKWEYTAITRARDKLLILK